MSAIRPKATLASEWKKFAATSTERGARFAWVGTTDPGSVLYYRIHSPVILIDFDHHRPAHLRHLAADPLLPNVERIPVHREHSLD